MSDYLISNFLKQNSNEQLFILYLFSILGLLLLIIFMLLLFKFTDNKYSSIYAFYKSNSDNLYTEKNKIAKKLKELNKITNELNGLITSMNASIEARKEIIETLQEKVNSLSIEENALNEKINTLNLVKDKPTAINDVLNDFFRKNNKNETKKNIVLNFFFCLLGFILSKLF